MNMLWHDYSGVKLVSRAVIVQAVLKNYIPRSRRELRWDQLAERHEDRTVGFLIMRQHAPVIVHSF
jgi:hypothetical protein